MVQDSPNPNSLPSLRKAQADLKSLLQQALVVFCCFVVMLVLTGGKPPVWLVPTTFLIAGGFVFWNEWRREKDVASVARTPTNSEVSRDSMPPFFDFEQWTSMPTATDAVAAGGVVRVEKSVNMTDQDSPTHFLQQGLIQDWNKWKRENKRQVIDLSGTELSFAKLNGANLSGASLRNANFIRANLIRANLSDADIIGADIIGANLSRADLSFAKLNGAILSGADLSRAILSGTDLSGAILRGADLSGAILSNAILSSAILSNAILSSANLRGAILSNANLRGAILSGAILRGANVANAQLGKGLGLSEAEKHELAQRGAIFEEAPGDRALIFH